MKTLHAAIFLSCFSLLAVSSRAAQDPAPAPIPEQEEEAGISEDLLKLRDPFKRPFVEVRPEIPKLDLENYPVEALKLVAVLTGPSRMRAMVLAPDGKTYMVAEKSRIGVRGGTVKRITAEAIFVREKMVNVLGKMENVETEIRMMEAKPKYR